MARTEKPNTDFAPLILWRFGLKLEQVRTFFARHASIERPLTDREITKLVNDQKKARK